MDSFVGLVNTFMDVDVEMDEAQFTEQGTRYYSSLASAWQNAAPHLFRAEQIRRMQNRHAHSTTQPKKKTTSEAVIANPSSMDIDEAPTPRAQPTPKPPAPRKPASAAPPAKLTSTIPVPRMSHLPSHDAPVVSKSVAPTKTTGTAAPEKPLPQAENAEPKTVLENATTPVSKATPSAPSQSKSTAAPAPTNEMSTGEDGKPAKARASTNHVSVAESVRAFLKLVESGAHKPYLSSLPPCDDIYNQAKADLATYEGAPEKNKGLIRSTGKPVKDWIKLYEACVNKSSKQPRKANGAKSDVAAAAAPSKSEVERRPMPAPLIPSASLMNTSDSTLVDTEAPIVSNFVGKVQQPPTAPVVNEKKRAHDQVEPKPVSAPKQQTAAAPPKPTNKVSTKPPPPKRSKYIIEEAEEDDEDGEDLDFLEDSLDGFIDNSLSDEDSFIDNGDEEEEEDEEDDDEIPSIKDSDGEAGFESE